jgi:metal-dependent amidase/aminoacylase/carboxypeptidase family protein
MESYVRGSSFDAIVSANKKVNRALTGAALSQGASVEIIDIRGYAPLHNDPGMVQVAKDAFALVCPGEQFYEVPRMGTGSTDMGDLSCIMPVVHPYAGGATGKSHGNDYQIADAERACVTNAKWQLAMIRLLLSDGASRAKQIVADY